MIKRSFFTLTSPTLCYDPVEPDPKEPASIPIPPHLILLINEPIDSTKDLLIKKADAVKRGEKLCLYGDSTEYAVSPVTGKIKTIDTYSDDFGNIATYLVVSNNQRQTADTKGVTVDLKEEVTSADAVLRGLPGAPPLKTFADDAVKVNTLVIMCADTDLLCTTNQFMAVKYLDDIKSGTQILKKIIQVETVCIVIPEDLNIQDSFGSTQVFKTSIEYPSNLPAMILKDHLNIVLPPGQTPEDAGVCFVGAEAVVSLARAYHSKSADFEKVVAVIGKQGIVHRVKATIGTPLHRIFNVLNIHINDQDRIIIGGPLRGFATYTHHHPVTPDMDTIILQDSDIIPELSGNACVNCGRCIQICPANIPVNLLVRYLSADQYEAAFDKFDLGSCIECGLCAYTCLARIPLYQYIRLGKHELLKLKADA